MKDKLQKARDLLDSGNLAESLKLIKELSQEVSGYLGICPGCRSEVPILKRGPQEFSECPNCGALWGKHTVDKPLIKYGGKGDSGMVLKKKDIVERLWQLYQQGEPGVDAFDINHFEATGWLKKSLAEKLQLPVPGEQREEELRKGDYSGDAQKWISNKISILMDEGKPQDQAVAIAHEMARKKGMKVPMHKTRWEEEGYGDRLTKGDILDGMLRMIKENEESNRVNRHTIAKFETTGEIEEDVLKMVYKKLGKNFYSLNKSEEINKAENEHAKAAQEHLSAHYNDQGYNDNHAQMAHAHMHLAGKHSDSNWAKLHENLGQTKSGYSHHLDNKAKAYIQHDAPKHREAAEHHISHAEHHTDKETDAGDKLADKHSDKAYDHYARATFDGHAANASDHLEAEADSKHVKGNPKGFQAHAHDSALSKSAKTKTGKDFYALKKKEDRPPKEVEDKVEEKESKNIWKEKRMSACPKCDCHPCECEEMGKEGKCPRCEHHPCVCPDAKKTYKTYGAKPKLKKRKGDSDLYDDKKKHAHHRRGALKPVLAKDKKKS